MRFLLSFIKTIIIIEHNIIAKNVIKTANVDSVIENSFGIEQIKAVTPANEIPSAKPFINDIGKHNVARFKKPV